MNTTTSLATPSALKRLTSIATVLALTLSACGPGPTNIETLDTTNPTDTTPTTNLEEPVGTSQPTQPIPDTPIRLGDSILGQALQPTPNTATGRFEGTLVQGGNDEMPDFVVLITGSFNTTSESAEYLQDSTLILAEFEKIGVNTANPENGLLKGTEIIVIGDQLWKRFHRPGFSEPWGKIEPEHLRPATYVAFGNCGYQKCLQVLQNAETRIEPLGQEDVRGTPTTHYRANINIEQLTATLTPEQQAALNSNLPDNDFTTEFWIDDQGQLRRYHITMTEIDERTASDDLPDTTVTFDIFDYGTNITIAPPPTN